MGRQIHFHMLPEDRDEFLRFVQERDSVVLTRRDGDSLEVRPATRRDIHSGKTLCLWNPRFLRVLEREWITEPGYYRVDALNTPTLEFTPSFRATWEGRPALGQGRLFGNFEPYLKKPKAFEKWYETLARWIRTHYHKNPRGTGGYVGPRAYEFYQKGGYLLPNFLPPRTKEWLAEIGKQHSELKARGRISKRDKA
jgi:hypothetical protein